MSTFTFREHDVQITGEKHHLEELVELLRKADVEGTLGDLVYQIEYAFDIDGIRSANEEEDPDYLYLGDEDWFGEVRWCDEDIEVALEDNGYAKTPENIAVIRRYCDHHFFKDTMIAAGWNCINAYVWENRDRLTREEVDDLDDL